MIALTHLPGLGTGLALMSSTPSFMVSIQTSFGGSRVEISRRQSGVLRSVVAQDVLQVAVVHQVLHGLLDRLGQLGVVLVDGDALGSGLDDLAYLLYLAA